MNELCQQLCYYYDLYEYDGLHGTMRGNVIRLGEDIDNPIWVYRIHE